jgi:hypothetical protein
MKDVMGSIRASVEDLEDSLRAYTGNLVHYALRGYALDTVVKPVSDSFWYSVRGSVWESVRNCVYDSVGNYMRQDI